MTTTIIPKTSGPDYVTGHYSYRELPALFNDTWLESLFGTLNQAFDLPNAVYPYNVLQKRDKSGEIESYEIHVALAGVGKNNISVKVKDSQLHIDVIKANEEDIKTSEYLRKGISQRKGSISFHLNDKVDTKKITSSYNDGLLIVTIPVIKPEIVDIDIKVS
jgi:HSP20 family protein